MPPPPPPLLQRWDRNRKTDDPETSRAEFVCIYCRDSRKRARKRTTFAHFARYGKVCVAQANAAAQAFPRGNSRSNVPPPPEIVKGSEMDRMARARAHELSRQKLLRQFHTPRTLCRAIYDASERLALRGMFISVISASFF